MALYVDGIPDNMEELSEWLNRIDKRIANIGVSNLNYSLGRVVSQAPQVTGLRLVPNLNTITVEWNPIPVRNLDFYEIQVSASPTWALPTVHRQRSIKYTYQEGDPGETYYVRVRAKPIDGRYGEWSGTLNTETGVATVTHLQKGAATAPTDSYFDLSGGPLDPYQTYGAGNNSVTATYGGTSILSKGGTVLPFIIFKYKVASDWNAAAPRPQNEAKTEIDVLRSGPRGEVVVDSVTVSSYSNFGTYNVGAPQNSIVARVPNLALGSPDDPGAGRWRYRVRLTVYGDSSGANPSYIRVDPQEMIVELLELRS